MGSSGRIEGEALRALESVDLGGPAQCNCPTSFPADSSSVWRSLRQLVHQPRLLVCDEPTAALDAQSGQRVMELLKKVAVQPGRAVIVVTHDDRVFRYGDRIITMADGHVVAVSENHLDPKLVTEPAEY